MAAIQREIDAAGGCITFARFMELALYHPRHGYYHQPRRDYQTSPELHPLFGILLARQLAQMWREMGQPAEFEVVEIGAGRGHLVRSLHPALTRLIPGSKLRYKAMDVGLQPANLPQGADNLLYGVDNLPQGVEWSGGSLADLSAESIHGCIVSNELVDAFPVHQVVMQGGELREVYVELGNEATPFREALGPLSTPQLAAHFAWLGLPLPEGHRIEVNLAARRWMADAARALGRGFVLTIDYGYPAEEMLSRPQGTLVCYYRQQFSSNPLVRVGYQDITAHVDFSSLVEAGLEHGLHFTGMVPQGAFLHHLGLDAYLRGLEQSRAAGHVSAAYAFDQRQALRELSDRRGMGAFQVLVQHKGLVEPSVDGLNPTNRRKRALWAEPPRWPLDK